MSRMRINLIASLLLALGCAFYLGAANSAGPGSVSGLNHGGIFTNECRHDNDQEHAKDGTQEKGCGCKGHSCGNPCAAQVKIKTRSQGSALGCSCGGLYCQCVL